MNKEHPYRPWFNQFILYNLVLLGLQFLFILSKQGSFIQVIPLPIRVYLELFGTFVAHFCLYILLSILQTFLLWGLIKRHLDTQALQRWHIIIWLLTVITLLTCNGYFFPLSTFSQLFMLTAIPTSLIVGVILLSLLILGLLMLNALLLLRWRYRSLSLSCILLLFFFNYSHHNNQVTARSNEKKPNIIIIGIDSLTPKSIHTKEMPTLSHLLQQSVIFKETISPLARTYPAWTSILTGLYPHHHGARYNLIPASYVKRPYSIAWSLKKQGYQTLFATDDRRFNNLDEPFGFDTIIAPKMGVNDFLLGNFNDFPLSNLLLNWPIAHWIFPYNYMNRASHVTYYPKTFDEALQTALCDSTHPSPSFIAVHFTLAHWPYAFASSLPANVRDEYSNEERGELYHNALQGVDKQIKNLLSTLKIQGYLDNSMLILLSDHGEALYVPGSRQTLAVNYQGKGGGPFANYLQRKTSTPLDMSVGHGSDLLSPTQYHALLAFTMYRHQRLVTTPKTIDTRVALIDIAPTIRGFLSLPEDHAMDGLSLLNTIIDDHTSPLPKRAFIMESGMLPNQILTQEKARQLGKQFFRVTSKGRLQLRADALPTLDALKLFAVIQGPWVFALYPDDDGYIPVILHLKNGKWSDKLDSDFTQKSPAVAMLQTLQTFYKKKWPLSKASLSKNP